MLGRRTCVPCCSSTLQPRSTTYTARHSGWSSRRPGGRGFGTVSLDEVPNQVATGKVLLQPPAGSSHRPLIVVVVRKHLPPPNGGLSELERFVVLVLDTAASFCWDAAGASGQHFDVLFDLRGICRKNLHLKAVGIIFSLIERRFPERLCTIYLLDAGPLFRSLYYLVEPFIDATSRQKLKFVTGEAGKATLVQEMGPDVVPTELGGAAAAVPIEAAVRRLPAWQEQQRRLVQQQSLGAPAAGAQAVEGGAAVARTAAAAAEQQQQLAAAVPLVRAASGLATEAPVHAVAAY